MIGDDQNVSALVDKAAILPAHVRAIDDIAELNQGIDLVIDLSIDGRHEALRMLAERGRAYSSARVIIVNGITITATAASSALSNSSLLALSFLPGVTRAAAHIELASAMQCDRAVAQHASVALAALVGRPVERVEDRVALVAARVLAMVINEAAFAVMENVASPSDVDTAMKLGTNYPIGPLAWSDAIGHEHVVDILDALFDEYHEERYRACVLLRQYSRARRRFVAS